MKFKLEPYYDCTPVGNEQAGVWESHASDPQFVIRPQGRLLAEGLCKFTFRVDPAYPKWARPKMYFDCGDGISEEGSASLRIETSDDPWEVSSWIRLPANVRMIRFDPTCAPGTFSLQPTGAASRRGVTWSAIRKVVSILRERGFSALVTRVVGGGTDAPEAQVHAAKLVSTASDFQRHLTEMTTKRDRSYIAAPAFDPAPDVGVKLVAYYLPQFHPIAENDAWWGRGFTEWTNVGKALPTFAGHYQPRLPGELGYYDLRGKDAMRRQIELAKHHGVQAFCFYYYWFDGHRLLEKPVEAFLKDPSLDIEFCLCWANENWSRRWDGSEHDILIAQNHSEEDDIAIIDDLIRAFKDRRYLRVDGKPVLIVYRADILPEVEATLARWRSRCQEHGIGEVHLVAAETFGLKDPTRIGFDAGVEFPPHGVHAGVISDKFVHYNADSQVTIYDYNEVAAYESQRTYPNYPLYRCAMPSWDNTARKGVRANVFHGSTPESFKVWLSALMEQASLQAPSGQRLVFINAWNEWAEGAYLEPDRRLGYANLMACHRAISGLARKGKPKVSVVVPMYKHESYVEQAIRSVLDQTFDDFELILVDDCSPDKTFEKAKEVLARHDGRGRARLYRMPNNADAFNVINTAIANSLGDYIAILNSDDVWSSNRLAVMLDAMERTSSQIAFSKVVVIDENGEFLAGKHPAAREIYRRQDELLKSNSPLMLQLMQGNVAVTTGNFIFSRDLFNKVGGFSQLRLCHDWDFILRASYHGAPLFVNTDGYLYRVHSSNTFSAVSHLAEEETKQVLGEFFSRFGDHPQYDLLKANAGYARLMSSDFYKSFLKH